MKVARSVDEIRGFLSKERPRRTGFVPTMGALHDGHMSLVSLARARSDVVITSVFVNPLQFGVGEDLERYPRDETGDLAALESANVDVVFLPSTQEMYPHGAELRICVGRLGAVLEGAHRPGHFDGVATVVAKLFNIVEPDVAVFGQKDAQQVAVVRRLIADLDHPVELVVGPTVREPDGLALSSRNRYLDRDERRKATVLYRALSAGAAALEDGGVPAEAERSMTSILGDESGVEVDYAVAVDPNTFDAPDDPGHVLLAVAVRIGTTRLIDNVVVDRGTRGERTGS